MKYAGLKKFRWFLFAFAIGGLIQTPFVTANAIAVASTDHRVIVPFLLAFAIRCFVIFCLFKVWWETRSTPESQQVAPTPGQ